MRIKKNLSLAILEVDTKTGKLWLNSPGCVLRISGIEFINKSITDKFSFIDIIDNKAVLIKGEASSYFDENLNDFLIQLIQLMHLNLQEKTNIIQKQYYKKLMKVIKEF